MMTFLVFKHTASDVKGAFVSEFVLQKSKITFKNRNSL